MRWRKADEVPTDKDFPGVSLRGLRGALLIIDAPDPADKTVCYGNWDGKNWWVAGWKCSLGFPWLPVCEIPGPEEATQ